MHKGLQKATELTVLISANFLIENDVHTCIKYL